MRNRLGKVGLISLSVLALSFGGIGAGLADAVASGPVQDQQQAQQAGPAITITDFIYSPDQLAAPVGQPITITNNDAFPHTVTAEDGTFDVLVPENGSVTLTVPKAGSFPYFCTYHPGQHNPASIKVS